MLHVMLTKPTASWQLKLILARFIDD